MTIAQQTAFRIFEEAHAAALRDCLLHSFVLVTIVAPCGTDVVEISVSPTRRPHAAGLLLEHLPRDIQGAGAHFVVDAAVGWGVAEGRMSSATRHTASLARSRWPVPAPGSG